MLFVTVRSAADVLVTERSAGAGAGARARACVRPRRARPPAPPCAVFYSFFAEETRWQVPRLPQGGVQIQHPAASPTIWGWRLGGVNGETYRDVCTVYWCGRAVGDDLFVSCISMLKSCMEKRDARCVKVAPSTSAFPRQRSCHGVCNEEPGSGRQQVPEMLPAFPAAFH